MEPCPWHASPRPDARILGGTAARAQVMLTELAHHEYLPKPGLPAIDRTVSRSLLAAGRSQP